MTARLLLICHASTTALRHAAFPADEPLDAYGRDDAAALAGRLPPADRFWSSPELRARQTAQALQLDAEVQPTLRDCDYGAWRGRTLNEINAEQPDAVAAWLREPAATPHGGESILSLMGRVATWLSGELANQGRTIVVAHPSIIRAAIVHALDALPQSFWRIDIAPLSHTRLSGTSNRWNVVAMGCSGNESL